MIGAPSSPSSTGLGHEELVRVLALLNGRARAFRFTAAVVLDGDAVALSTVFDRDTLGASHVDLPDGLIPHHARVLGSKRSWSTDGALHATGDALAGDAAEQGMLAPGAFIRSYAGAPLVDANDVAFGALCHFDPGAATLDAPELSELEATARALSPWLRTHDAALACREAASTRDRAAHVEERLRASELWFSTTLASIGDAVIATDEKALVTYLNPVAAELTGWTLDEARGRPLDDVFPIFHETTGARVESPTAKVLREGRVVGLANHTVLRHRSGALTPIEDSASPIRAPGGPITGVVLVFRDATALRAAERERERRFADEQAARGVAEGARDRSDFLVRTAHALSDGLGVGAMLQKLVQVLVPERADYASLWTVDARRHVRRVASAPVGAAPNEPETGATPVPMAPTFPVLACVDADAILRIDDVPARIASSGDAEDVAVVERLALKEAVLVPVHHGSRIVAVLSLAARAGRTFGAADEELFEAVARQAALAVENGRLFADAERLRRAAEEATLAKDQFLARVSHDLRNPLGSILGWASLLKSHRRDGAQVAKGLDVIERNAKAQVQLIEDLLDVSRITSGKLRLELASLHVATALETALDAARFAATAKGVELTVTVDPEVGSIAVDPERFQQIVWNLASNAVKFTPSGGAVRVTAARKASHLRIVVEDNGRGIERQFLPYVFDKFQQADQGVQRAGGLGLGLAIVRHVVELHGGTVEVESDGVGAGARFTIWLPIRAAVPSRAPSIVDEREVPARLLEGIKALVVDDEDEARDVLATILRQAGASIIVARSADEALEKLIEETPAALVSDVGMPDKNGYALIRAVRSLKRAEHRRVPAVALTALARATDRIDALAAGFNAHVTKPVEPRELVLVLAGVLGREMTPIGADAEELEARPR